MTETPSEPDDTVAVGIEAADTELGDTEPAETEPAESGRDRAASTLRSETRGRTGDAVPEPKVELSAEMRAKMFKKPLDRVRRAPVSPFAPSEDALPRGGVRADLPVRYTRRSEEAAGPRGEVTASAVIGAPPQDHDVAAVDRTGMRSVHEQSQRFARVAYFGGAIVLLAAGFGLWWIAEQLFGA